MPGNMEAVSISVENYMDAKAAASCKLKKSSHPVVKSDSLLKLQGPFLNAPLWAASPPSHHHHLPIHAYNQSLFWALTKLSNFILEYTAGIHGDPSGL